jgi:hypothetical protein
VYPAADEDAGRSAGIAYLVGKIHRFSPQRVDGGPLADEDNAASCRSLKRSRMSMSSLAKAIVRLA